MRVGMCSEECIDNIRLGIWLLGQAQPVKVGEVSDDFEITNRETGELLKLSDYDGHVVVLDFFAWWCGLCRTSSPDVEKNVAQFFHDRDGNEHGVPVTVIGVNIEEDNPDRTDQFVKDSGMSLVVDDLSEVAYKLYNERSAIPLFVILMECRVIVTMINGRCFTKKPL